MRLFNKYRRSEFLLREQDEGGDDAAKGADYKPPRERILQTPDVSDTLTEKNASLDEIVDKYFIQYEKEAVPLNQDSDATAPKPISESRARRRTKKALYSFLFEQDDAAAPPADAPADDAPADDAGGGDAAAPGAAAAVAPVPQINIREFAEGVARLTSNYKTLIDPETVIMNRAMYYISKNYSPRLSKEMMSILQRDFNLTPKTKNQQKSEIPAAPRQGGAGPDNGGGAPSGGGGD